MEFKNIMELTFAICLLIVLVGLFCIGSFTTHIRYNKKKRKNGIAQLNKSNRFFLAGIFAFFFGLWFMVSFGIETMDIMRVIFDNKPLGTMSGFVIAANLVTVLFGYCFYNASGLGIKLARVELERVLKRRRRE